MVFYERRHPRDLGPAAVGQFLPYLAVERKVSASTQSQALRALLLLYRHVLEQHLPWLDGVISLLDRGVPAGESEAGYARGNVTPR